MKRLKQTKGITLVALVVTIIVLLILAGISIQAITNQGLFGRTNEAKRESEIANIKEQIALDIYEKQLEPPLGSITDEQLETILGKYGTVNKEDGTIVGITTGKGYEILLKDIYGGETVAESVPDGAVVTPINDITTWLKTGEISKQYSYTTIEQVIADSTCTESLMNNENAMKYLARSTEFANAICASETTMTYLGQSAYVDNTMLNSDIWSEKICKSAYFESVLCDKVPTMTSNTQPSGEVSASSTHPEASSSMLLYPWNSFDGLLSNTSGYNNGWHSSMPSTFEVQWLQYKFIAPIRIKKFEIYRYLDKNTVEYTAKIQASNDGKLWDDIKTITVPVPSVCNEKFSEYLNNDKYYLYYRYSFITSNIAVHNGCGVTEIQLYGRMQN